MYVCLQKHANERKVHTNGIISTTQPATKLIEYSRLFDTRGSKSYLTFVSVQCTKPKFSLQVTVDRSIVDIEAENVLKTQNC